MNINIFTVGTRGDVQPYVALGAGLQAAGHQITIVTSAQFAEMIQERGLLHAPLRIDFLQMMETPEGRAALGSGKGALRLIKQISSLQRQMLEEEWAVSQNADAIIYHPKALGGYHIAEKMGIPAFLAMMAPAFSPTRTFPNPVLARSKSLGGFLNKASYSLVNRLTTITTNSLANTFRKETLGLPPRSAWANDLILHGQSIPRLYAYSETVLPRPADWDSSTVVTGYWFLDSIDTWHPPQALERFLQSGPPPLYIGFGSMAGRRPEQTTKLVLEALRHIGQRAVLATGVGGLVQADIPDSVFLVKSAPHDWLFPRMAGIVHHGGAGTTAAALRAGKPMLICPFFGDQPFWGQRIYELEVGPEPLPQKHLTAEKLANRLQQMIDNKDMHRRAAMLGETIRAENGVERAVQIIHQHLTKNKS